MWRCSGVQFLSGRLSTLQRMLGCVCRYVAWVTAAFGPFWGFQEGWWSWLSGVTDNSVYPVLFLTYLDAVLPGIDPKATANP